MVAWVEVVPEAVYEILRQPQNSESKVLRSGSVEGAPTKFAWRCVPTCRTFILCRTGILSRFFGSMGAGGGPSPSSTSSSLEHAFTSSPWATNTLKKSREFQYQHPQRAPPDSLSPRADFSPPTVSGTKLTALRSSAVERGTPLESFPISFPMGLSPAAAVSLIGGG